MTSFDIFRSRQKTGIKRHACGALKGDGMGNECGARDDDEVARRDAKLYCQAHDDQKTCSSTGCRTWRVFSSCLMADCFLSDSLHTRCLVVGGKHRPRAEKWPRGRLINEHLEENNRLRAIKCTCISCRSAVHQLSSGGEWKASQDSGSTLHIRCLGAKSCARLRVSSGVHRVAWLASPRLPSLSRPVQIGRLVRTQRASRDS